MKRWLAVLGFVLTVSACASPVSTKTTQEGKPAPGAYRIWLGDGFNQSQPMTVVDGSGKTLRTLPQGAAASDWSRLYTIERRSNPPLLLALDPATGDVINRVQVPSAFDFPLAFAGDRPGSALSPNNAWLVLQSLDRKAQAIDGSHYLVFDKDLKNPARRVDLKGFWQYDALSNSGNSLYLLENVGKQTEVTHYQVRRYDLAAGRVAPGAIVDKRERPGEAMSGTRAYNIPTPDGGWVYSLYIFGGKGPFIHALNLVEPLAWCIDLPNRGKDYEQQMLWSMAMTPDGSKVYAINASLGTFSEIAVASAGAPTVTRTATFKVSKPQSFDWFGLVLNAEAKRVIFGGAALSPDVKTLYAIGEDGVYAIDTAGLTLKGHYLAGHTLESLALSPDGTVLFATSAGAGDGKLLWVETATGVQSEIGSNSHGATIIRVQSGS